jgi:hypothetical protein
MAEKAESFDVVVDDLRHFLNDTFATHAFLGVGLRRAEVWLTEIPTRPENPDPTFFMGTGNPNEMFAPYAKWRISEALQQLRTDGPLDQRIGQQWLVVTFTGWEHEYRPRLARAAGVKPDALSFPLLGDIRHLRHDVVHHHGVATHEHAGRCTVIRHWVEVGNPIKIGGAEIGEFAQIFPWHAIEALGPVSRPSRRLSC